LSLWATRYNPVIDPHPPRPDLRRSALGVFGGAWLLTIGSSWLVGARTGSTWLYPWAAATFFGVVAVIAFASWTPARGRFGPANLVTTARASVVALAAGLLAEPDLPGAIVPACLVSMAAVLDGIDGWVARRTGMTPFGAQFDIEIDALTMLALAALVWRYDKAPAWVLLSGLLRYVFVAAGWVWSWMRRPLGPSRRRQIVGVCLMVCLIAALTPVVPAPLSVWLAALSVVSVSGSLIVDVIWLRRQSLAPAGSA
jgi:phosphatidylglycerophosphate synthase